MKKFLISLICHNLLILPAFCMITDDFAEQTLDKTKPYPKPANSIIIDEFAESNTAKNQYTKNSVDLNESIPTCSQNSYITKKKVIITDKVDLTKVEIRIKNAVSTKDKTIDEGDYIEFETVKDVYINNKHYPKGTVVRARIENISQNGMKGVPADIVLANFTLANHNLIGEVTKTGANRSLWLYPVSYIGTGFFGLGPLLLFIRGGHAKINRSQTFILHVK